MSGFYQIKRAVTAAHQLWQARKLPVELDGFTIDKPVFFIGGSGRSGTTLLRMMLGAHSKLYSGPELNAHTNTLFRLSEYAYLPKKSFRLFAPPTITRLAQKFSMPEQNIRNLVNASSCLPDFMDRLLTSCAEREGKTYWLEKSPANVKFLPFIFRNFPKAKFVHVIRDGRDTICSLRSYKSFTYENGMRQKSVIQNSLGKATAFWHADVLSGLQFRGHPRYLEIRYEDLVRNPEQTLRDVCTFYGIPFEPALLKHHNKNKESGSDFIISSANAAEKPNTSRIGRWKKDLSSEDAKFVQRHAGELLSRLGYIASPDWTKSCK